MKRVTPSIYSNVQYVYFETVSLLLDLVGGHRVLTLPPPLPLSLAKAFRNHLNE
jgi:hypothetical protein